jgi:hypothetical protein
LASGEAHGYAVMRFAGRHSPQPKEKRRPRRG